MALDIFNFNSFEAIGPALGMASTVIIPWHGCITVGRNIERAAALHATLEQMARMDVILENTDAPEIPEEQRLGLRKLVDRLNGKKQKGPRGEG